MSDNKYSNYFFIATVIVLLIMSYFLIKPFFSAIVASVVLSYLLYPLYKRLNLIIKNKAVCSLIFILTITIVIMVPIFFLTNTLINESLNIYSNLKKINLNVVTEFISKYIGETVKIDVEILVHKVLTFLVKPLTDFAFSLPERLINIFITLFLIYYFLQEGERIVERIKELTPLSNAYKNVLIKRFHETVYATFYGIIITGIIQGAVGTIGLFIFKVKAPLFFGALMTLFAILPYLGAGIIWLPISLYKIFTGDLFNGIGLLLYSLLITSTIDNLIRPHLISKKADIHPILILLGIAGGLKLFGFIGVIIGPIILTTFYTVLEVYVTKYGTKG